MSENTTANPAISLLNQKNHLHFGKFHFLLGIFTVMLVSVAYLIPSGPTIHPGNDWYTCFRPAILDLVNGFSPYSTPGFFNSPWVLIPLAPFAFLPPIIGAVILSIAPLLVTAYISMRMGFPKISLFAILLSPMIFQVVFDPNVDWLVLLGAFLPPNIGLFFVLIKPQLGAGIALFWTIQAWRTNGLLGAIKLITPVYLAFMISFVLFGLWPLKSLHLVSVNWNQSIFPFGVPIGILIMLYAFRKKSNIAALASTPFFSPYVWYPSWMVSILPVAKNPKILIPVICLSWIVILGFRFWFW